MYLANDDRDYLYCEYNIKTGEVGDFMQQNSNESLNPPTCGSCKETNKGWVAVYGQGGDLFFQFNTTRWKLTDKNTQYSRSSGNEETFSIYDRNNSFEVNYNHWLNDSNSFIDMDLPEEDHDFFAWIVWLCKPENAQRIAEKWSKNNKEINGLEA